MGALNVVVTKNGYPRKGVKVKGSTNGGLFGATTSNEMRTNAQGHAMIEWSSNTPLSAIYIDGKKVSSKTKFFSGESYAFSI